MSLADRMKANYEDRWRIMLPRRTYTILRIDGRNFHRYTKHCEKPYDFALMEAFDIATKAVLEGLQGARFAYLQSDEVSILLTDFSDITTEAFFDGNLQKIVSVVASELTAHFNLVTPFEKTATMDCRAFIIPDAMEVKNYFIWRQQDATRNSISMAAQAQFSHKELHEKSGEEMQEMLFQKGVNWNDYPESAKRGRLIGPMRRTEEISFTHKKTGESETVVVERNRWENLPCPIFTREAVLDRLIPGFPIAALANGKPEEKKG